MTEEQKNSFFTYMLQESGTLLSDATPATVACISPEGLAEWITTLQKTFIYGLCSLNCSALIVYSEMLKNEEGKRLADDGITADDVFATLTGVTDEAFASAESNGLREVLRDFMTIANSVIKKEEEKQRKQEPEYFKDPEFKRILASVPEEQRDSLLKIMDKYNGGPND